MDLTHNTYPHLESRAWATEACRIWEARGKQTGWADKSQPGSAAVGEAAAVSNGAI